MRPTTSDCPCGSKRDYVDCCGPYHSGEREAPDAIALMRSRYSAFVLGDASYLLATWHASTRPAQLSLESGVKWLGLEVRQIKVVDPEHAEVEFVARQRDASGRAHRLHERSRFVRQQGRWFYVDGTII